MVINKKMVEILSSLDKSKKYLIGFSGGVDSVVLLDILKKFHFNVYSLYINHNIRDDTEKDIEILKKYNKNFFIENIDKHSSGSFENFARQERERIFQNYLNQGFNGVFLAHHFNDQIETVLFNIIKGNMRNGFNRIKYINGYKIRPLLDVKKVDIIQYAKKYNLSWHEDKTNTTNDYDRNWLRNSIIPELKSKRNVDKSLEKISITIAEIQEFIQLEALKYLDNFDINIFNNLHISLKKEILFLFFKKEDIAISYENLIPVIDFLSKNERTVEIQNIILVKDGNCLVVKNKNLGLKL